MGVVSRRWMWVESMGVSSGCGCKERYRFPHPYLLLFYLLFFSAASTFYTFLKCFSFLCYFFVIYVVIFSRSINTLRTRWCAVANL